MKNSLRLILFLFIVSISLHTNTYAQKLKSKTVDKIVNKTMETFNVPGIAVAIIKDGKVIHNKGYGYRSLESKEAVDTHTLFAIASNSKAFTSAALCILAEENKLSLNDKVRKYIPEFKLYNSYVSEEFTIIDLLTHRSGLGLGAGDLMIFPTNNKYTKKEIIHNLRYLKPVSSFRTKYDYDNLLYIVAGEIIERVSGLSWGEYVNKKILEPLGMTESAPSFTLLKDTSNIATPYVPIKEKLIKTSRSYNVNINPAGGIYSNTAELSKWVITQLQNGKYEGNKIFSNVSSRKMWASHTIRRPNPMPFFTSNFNSYGLGWEVKDINGRKEVSHTGGLTGMVSQVVMIPELNLGIIILTNQQSGLAFMNISDKIKDLYLNNGNRKRLDLYKKYESYSEKRNQEAQKEIIKILNASKNKIPSFGIIGTYTDKWFGDIKISKDKNQYYFTSEKSSSLKGKMYYYDANTFIVKWDDRTLNADAYIMFNLNEKGKPTTFTMKAISPITDFSFDFHDLHFKVKRKNNRIVRNK